MKPATMLNERMKVNEWTSLSASSCMKARFAANGYPRCARRDLHYRFQRPLFRIALPVCTRSGTVATHV